MPRGLLESEIVYKEDAPLPEKVIVVRRCNCGAYLALVLNSDSYTEWRFGRKTATEAFPEFNEKERDILDYATCSVCWGLGESYHE